MDNKYFIVIIIVIFVILFASGFFLGNEKIDVAGCAATWRSTPQTVQKSELCNQAQCTAQPQDQQHNAIIDAVLCACEKAKAGSYADADTNKKIEETVNLAFSYQTTAKEICDQPGLILVKHAYG